MKNDKSKGELLFIFGAPKTASSSMCALLNSHPDIFMMYEVEMGRYIASRYARRLITNYPETAKFFNRSTENSLASYRKTAEYFNDKGHGKKYFGDKIVSLSVRYQKEFADEKVIYTLRYLPEWLGKAYIRESYVQAENIVPLAVQYTKHFIQSFLMENCFHVRMRDFIDNNASLINDIAHFLELEPTAFAKNWWETLDKYADSDPKKNLKWWNSHESSMMEPQEKDTIVEINPECEFWKIILPVFEKYLSAIPSYNSGKKIFSEDQIKADMMFVDRLIDKYEVSLEEAYLRLTQKVIPSARKTYLKL